MAIEHSKFPLMRLASKYAQMQEDNRLLSNRASLEVVRFRIQELLERLQENDAPERFKKLYALWQKYRACHDKLMRHSIELELNDAFEDNYHDYEAWNNMFSALELDRKLVESEVKIIKEIKAILTAEDAYNLTAQLLASIVNTVNESEMSDKAKTGFLKRIQYEFTRIVGDGFDEGVRASGSEVSDPGSSDLD